MGVILLKEVGKLEWFSDFKCTENMNWIKCWKWCLKECDLYCKVLPWYDSCIRL